MARWIAANPTSAVARGPPPSETSVEGSEEHDYGHNGVAPGAGRGSGWQ